MAVKRDGTYGGLVRRKKKLENLIDLKTRRLGIMLMDSMDDLTLRTLAGMSDADLRRVAGIYGEGHAPDRGPCGRRGRPPAFREAG